MRVRVSSSHHALLRLDLGEGVGEAGVPRRLHLARGDEAAVVLHAHLVSVRVKEGEGEGHPYPNRNPSPKQLEAAAVLPVP